MKDLLLELNIRLPDIIAGFMGGVVNAVVFKRTSPWAFIGSVLVGAIMANYFGDVVSAKTGINGGTAAFLVGMTGMATVQAIVSAVPAIIAKWGQITPSKSEKPDA